MQIIIFTFIFVLIVNFLAVSAIAVIELNARRKQQENFLSTGITVQGIRCNSIKLYPATFWYLFNKWVRFTGVIFILVGGIGSLFVSGFISGGSTIVEAIWQTARILLLAMLIFTIPLAFVCHLFGARIGMNLLACAEYGTCQEGLLYCPFTQWYLIPWSSITRIRSTWAYMGKIPGFLIEGTKVSLFPNWYQAYLCGKADRFSLILLCLLPDALKLKEEIEKHITQHG